MFCDNTVGKRYRTVFLPFKRGLSLETLDPHTKEYKQMKRKNLEQTALFDGLGMKNRKL